MATFYLDFEGGDDSKDGTTFANRWKTITSGATAARTAPGDTIRIMKSPDPVSLGVNGTFTKQSATVTLASAVSANISLCQANWTQGTADVTMGTSTTRKEGTVSVSIAPTAAFTTGVLAYEATGTLDLSAYQNVSLWVRSSIALSANALRLDLCTDTAGATPAHSFTIDTAFAASVWKPITFKNGSALNSAIKSVALTALTDFGAATILIDNIIATNELHFNSLIGTSSSATGQIWYPLKSINGTTVVIGNEQDQGAASTARGWHDTTTTTTAYVRDTIRLTAGQTCNESGSATGRIIYSGGWDRTNMSSQNGLTMVSFDRNLSATGTVLNVSTFTYITFERLSVLWGANSFHHYRNSNYFFKCGSYGSQLGSQESFGPDNYSEDMVYISNEGSVAFAYSTTHKNLLVYSGAISSNVSDSSCYLYDCSFINNATGGYNQRGFTFMQNCTFKDNGSSAFRISGYLEANGITSSGHNTTFGSGFYGTCRVNNLTSTDTAIGTALGIQTRNMLSRYSTYAGVVSTGNKLLAIYDVNTPLHGSASRSFSHNPVANTTTYVPFVQPLQPFAVGASTLVTFKIWVYRDSTNVEGRVRLKGYVTPGVDADVTATITAAINTWEELSVTCTPSAAGVVQIDLESYSVNGSTGTVYFGDATVSQA